nr:MAG TPA: hypothetical protein [Caudoviricetes sp.]
MWCVPHTQNSLVGEIQTVTEVLDLYTLLWYNI